METLVRTKAANWSQKVLSIGILLSLVAGCSSEPSAQEKRNNFDRCLIEQFEGNVEKLGRETVNRYRQSLEENAKIECKKYLK